MIILAYIDPSAVTTVTSGLAGLIAAISAFAAGGWLLCRKVVGHAGKHWGKLLLLILVIVSLIVGVYRLMPRDRQHSRSVYLLGLDGLSPTIIEPLMDAGELPNFSRLRERGSYTRLRTTNPPQSPVAWATFATGQNPGKHRLFDFIGRDATTYLPRISITQIDNGEPVPAHRGKAFWQYATDAGIESVILRCPVTFPPTPIHGRMLSGMGTPDLLGTQGTFIYFTSDATEAGRGTGGEVIRIGRQPHMQLELPGPNKKSLTGKIERVTVPFTVDITGHDSATLQLQQQEVALSKGIWSDWINVTFKISPLKKMHGITKVILVESTPHLRLYVSPIDIDPRMPLHPISHPPDYCKQLTEALGTFGTRGMPFDTWALSENRISDTMFLDHADALLAENIALMKHELSNPRIPLFFAYFEYPDIIQHMFWRFHDPDHQLNDTTAPARCRNAVVDTYKKMDEVVGVMLNAVDDDDLLLVFSDHGFDTFRRAVHLNSWLRQQGYLVLKRGATTGRELLQDVDWKKTRAYSLGFGGIYLNRQGRESQGVVPEADADVVTTAIITALNQWNDGDTKVVHGAHRNHAVFDGPYVADAPDIVVGFTAGYRASWQTALGAVPATIIDDNERKWSGDHLIDPELVPGVLFSSRPLSSQEPGIEDLAPTVLKEVGAGEFLNGADFDGKPLFDADK